MEASIGLEQFANSGSMLSEKVNITPVSDNGLIRTKNYEFTSFESGVQSYPNLTPSGWKFTSLTHTDMQTSGQSVQWTVECTRLVATPSLFQVPLIGTFLDLSYGKMKLVYDMKFTTDCVITTLTKHRNNLVSQIIWDVDE